jgi:hypothetical protein
MPVTVAARSEALPVTVAARSEALITRPRIPTICRNRLGNQKIRGGEGPKLDYRSQ